jgi:hypothetical protein
MSFLLTFKTAPFFCVHPVYSRTALFQTLVIRNANFPDSIGALYKFVYNYGKQNCHEITGYRIKYSTVLWLIELQITRG